MNLWVGVKNARASIFARSDTFALDFIKKSVFIINLLTVYLFIGKQRFEEKSFKLLKKY